MNGFEYRVIDTSGSEIGLVRDERPELGEDDELTLPDGRVATVLEIYDDEHGRVGGVVATVVVDEA